MTDQLTSRQLVKGLLQGIPQPRPLIVPIVFSLGAKIENLSLRAFLENPTKISNALRQIRSQLRTDGVSCYFDPLLELEALGGTVRWDSANQTRTIHWLETARKGDVPPGLRSPEEAANSPRVNAAVEVIRRLNSLFRDEPLLMAGVSGPFTVAARLTQLDAEKNLRAEDLQEPALEAAAATITKIASSLVEAGANLIFIREDVLPPLSADNCQSWASLLAPVFNIVRFYGALPVLQLARGTATASNCELILQQPWDAILCSTSPDFVMRAANNPETSAYGLAFPMEAIQSGDSSSAPNPVSSKFKAALLTTDGDIPVTTNLKLLMKTFDLLARQA